MQHFCNSWRVRKHLLMVLRLTKLAEGIVSLHTRLLRPSTNLRPFLQCILRSFRVVDNAREDHVSDAPNFHAERTSPQTAGDLNISNYTILDTFKLRARTIRLFAARPDALNPLSVVNSTLTKIQLKSWMHFPTSNTLKTSQTRSLNHCDLLCHGKRYTLAPALR